MKKFEEITQTYKNLLEETIQNLESLVEEKYVLCDVLLKTIHKADNNRQTYLNLQNGHIEPLIQEVFETIYKIEKYNIENHIVFLYNLTDEYVQICSQDVHPDIMKIKMSEHLYSTLKQICGFCEFGELREFIASLQKNLHTLFHVEPDCIHNIRKFEHLIYDCQHQCYENIHFLHTLMKYFSNPTECPPHL